MERKGFSKRFIVPVVIVFAVMAVSFVVYNASPRIDNHFLHQLTASVSAILLFLSIGFGVFFVYPFARFRGSGPWERIIASLVNPFLWATKEVVRVTATYTVAEALYFYLNPLVVSIFAGAVFEMGVAEILCRRAMKRRGEDVKVFSAPAAAAVIGLGVTGFILAWGLGVHSFYIFIEGYKAIFGITS